CVYVVQLLLHHVRAVYDWYIVVGFLISGGEGSTQAVDGSKILHQPATNLQQARISRPDALVVHLQALVDGLPQLLDSGDNQRPHPALVVDQVLLIDLGDGTSRQLKGHAYQHRGTYPQATCMWNFWITASCFGIQFMCFRPTRAGPSPINALKRSKVSSCRGQASGMC